MTLVLGIESSCDETSVAVVRDGRESLSNVIHSQIDRHAPFRGVVPEIASRAHLEKINDVYAAALTQAGVSPADLDCLAVTVRPGLVGSLMVGAQLAKCLALVHSLPVIPVDHLEAHMYAPCLEFTPGETLEYPFLGLLLSGGNSAIYRVDGPGRLALLGDTRDDACGEAFDKVATLLQLPYPGGPVIEKIAREHPERGWSEEHSLFPRLLRKLPEDELAFSYSGIKTAVARAVADGHDPARIAYDFQHVVFELVVRNLRRAVKLSRIPRIVASGGVLANDFLRDHLRALEPELRGQGGWIRWPAKKFHCTDNAGMVAALGAVLFEQAPERYTSENLDFGVSSRSSFAG